MLRTFKEQFVAITSAFPPDPCHYQLLLHQMLDTVTGRCLALLNINLQTTPRLIVIYPALHFNALTPI